jgi:hypothetical protein
MKHLPWLTGRSYTAILKRILGVFIAVACVAGAAAQTVSLNDASVVQAKTNRIGLNIGSLDYWDNGQILKNLIGSIDPGFEPLTDQQIWVVNTAGSTTSFTVPDQWDGVPANYWAGGTFTVVSTQSGGGEQGCTGTIASNTGPNYPAAGVTNWVDPVITVASPCAAPFSVGDIVVMGKTVFPTPESWWEQSEGGFWGSVGGGGQLLSDTSDLCATCGVQALNMNAAANGSQATASWFFDTAPNVDMFVLMNGTYQISFWAKAASGNPVLTVTAKRFSAGGFNCGSFTPQLTSAWAQYTLNCTATESTAATTPGNAQVSFQAAGGSIYLDNVSFAKTSSSINNPTVLRDEVIQTLQKFYGPDINNNPGMFRFWLSQNAETLANWTQPDYAHGPTTTGTGYFVGPNGAGTTTLSLEDYLLICQLLNAEPYLEVPVTFNATDAANLIEFLASPSSTAYGARRAGLGQSSPWTSVFNSIHLSFCNECWNGSSFVGQSLPYRAGTPNVPNTNNPEYYYDYSMRTKQIFAAMRADSYYSPSAFDLVMNAQTAVSYTMDTAIQRAQPDSIEIEGYSYANVNDDSSDAVLWGPAMVEPYERVANPGDATNYYNAVHDYQSQSTCGASGTAACNVNIYEWGQGTLAGSIDQTHMDYINAGAGEGVALALQPLLNLQYYGITNQSQFALTGYQNGAVNGLTAKLWGDVVDMGGATNNLRPAFLALSLVNQSIIGPMYSCPIGNNATYNFTGNANNGSPTMPALNNVPYLYAFCFENGSQRSLVLINTDLNSSHSLSFAGTNLPGGSVTERQYAPGGLDELNEAPTGSPSNLSPAPVVVYTSSLSSPASLTLPPYSVTALDYTAASTSTGTAATPSFSLAGGTYTGTQTVTLSDTTPSAAIYYTTNGTTPTSGSILYSGAIAVSASETVEAIAVASGSSNSAVASAAYVIGLPETATPSFSLGGGTYTGTQTVTLSDTTAGATIYYTTNGGTPTSGSTRYSGTIAVSASETVQAIAVASGYSNSAVASAAYVINPNVLSGMLANGTYTITNANSGLVVDLPASSTVAGTYVDQSQSKGGANQQWQLTNLGNNFVELVNVNSGLALEVAGSSGANGAAIDQSPYRGGKNQIWQVVNVRGTYYELVNENSGLALEVPGWSGAQGQLLDQWSLNGGANQQWTMVSNQPATATPTFSEGGGTYASAQTITLSDTTPGAAIYYTTNGTTPTTNSTPYSGAISVSASETIEAVAVASGYSNSAVASAAYTIDQSAATAPTFSEGGGTYASAQTITLSDTTPGAAIYYTTNGTTPTTSSTPYSGAITISASETIGAIAVAPGYSASSVASAAYQITAVGGLIPNGTYAITSRWNGLALDVPGWSGSQGTPLDQWTVTGTPNQMWQLVNLGGNLVELVNVNSGLALEVANSSTAAGAQIDQSGYSGAKNQIWSVVSVGGGYFELINQNSGMVLDVPGWSGSPGTLLDQWSSNGGANQQWSIH